MKIEDNRMSKRISFVDLPIGNCFIYEDTCYLKIDVSCSSPNVFDLKDNEKDSFSGSAIVLPVNAKVVIE